MPTNAVVTILFSPEATPEQQKRLWRYASSLPFGNAQRGDNRIFVILRLDPEPDENACLREIEKFAAGIADCTLLPQAGGPMPIQALPSRGIEEDIFYFRFKEGLDEERQKAEYRKMVDALDAMMGFRCMDRQFMCKDGVFVLPLMKIIGGDKISRIQQTSKYLSDNPAVDGASISLDPPLGYNWRS